MSRDDQLRALVEELSTKARLTGSSSEAGLMRIIRDKLSHILETPAEPVLSESVPRTAIVKLYERWLECARDLRDDGLGQAASDYEERAEELYERLLTPPAQPTQPEPSEAERESLEELLGSMRRQGWSVAVHNDYRLNGEAHTFWLFTKGERAVKGEARSDTEAVRAALDAAGAER